MMQDIGRLEYVLGDLVVLHGTCKAAVCPQVGVVYPIASTSINQM